MAKRRWFVEPLAVRLFALVSVLVLGALLPAGYFAARQHYESSLDLKRRETYLQDNVIAIALESQMLEDRRDLIRRMIDGFSTDPHLKRLLILDHTGRVQLGNDPAFAGRVFPRDSSACLVCHAFPSAVRATSAVIEIDGGSVLRSVYPLRNHEACHQCHDPSITVNGVIITDTDITDVKRQLAAQVKGMAALVGIIAVVLLAGVVLLVRALVLRRLERIEETTRAMARGDFTRRVDATGSDAVARLGQEFNEMADSVTGLLGQLRRQQTQLENVMGSVEDGLLVMDRTFTVVAVNNALAERIGDARENLLYRRCWEIWPAQCACGSGQADEHCPARACFETGRVQKSLRVRFTRDGAARQEEVFASPILDASGQVEQVVEVWRDITERQSREARMAEFQRLVSLGMLASGFSHEVNTPLGTMLLHVDDLRRCAAAGAVPVETLCAQVETIRTEILRCREITRQFLQLSRGQSVHQELLEIPALVRSTMPLIAQLAREAGVTVRFVEGGGAPIALANGGAVRQVLLNILLNAVQASPRGAEVRIALRSDAAHWIRIEDDGVGMSPDVRAKVFEPFFSGRPSGTGLGLFVSLNLVRQWGGDIRVSSEPGRGSAFEVSFPLAEEPCLSTAS
jgi:PAS domain S-box-containing protein